MTPLHQLETRVMLLMPDYFLALGTVKGITLNPLGASYQVLLDPGDVVLSVDAFNLVDNGWTQ